MLRQLLCPRGHQWKAAQDSCSWSDRCPVCGLEGKPIDAPPIGDSTEITPAASPFPNLELGFSEHEKFLHRSSEKSNPWEAENSSQSTETNQDFDALDVSLQPLRNRR